MAIVRNWQQAALATLFVIAIGGFLAIAIVKSRSVPEDSIYVGSATCRSCHADEHDQWHQSLHPKMMRRVAGAGVVVADLSPENQDILFDPEKAVWAIGSKWEQQFMGSDGRRETLLPGAWLVAGKKWQRTGWDGWQVPVPLQRCHGCHTVGLDVETGHFVEPGIGCESCHGPGGWHAKTYGLGQIHSSLDAQVCGQCHTRGRSTDGKYFFPVGYRPGQTLATYFREQTPSLGQNSSYWWGNGRERKRHQEYFAWRQGGHADSLKSLIANYDGRYGDVDSGCLGCHAAEAVLTDQRDLGIDEVNNGITCAVCHNVHGDLDKLRVTCSRCHGEGAFYHQPERNVTHDIHPQGVKVECVNCHMPLTVTNGGAFTLHTHSPGIVPPQDTIEFDIPNSCANGGCHANRAVDWLQAAFERHYPGRD